MKKGFNLFSSLKMLSYISQYTLNAVEFSPYILMYDIFKIIFSLSTETTFLMKHNPHNTNSSSYGMA